VNIIRTYAVICQLVSGNLAGLRQHTHATEQIEALVAANVGCGLVILDGEDRIASVNERAAAILRQCDGLALRDGALVSRRAAETRTLQALIESCWRTSRRGLGSPGGAAVVTRHSGKPHYVVRAMPIAARPGPRRRAPGGARSRRRRNRPRLQDLFQPGPPLG
jgi:hypothetical protein